MTKYTGKAALVAAVLVAMAGSASAQTSGNITATATVAQALTVNGNRNLAFGSVFPGAAAPRTIAITDATNSGRFVVSGAAAAQVTLDFTGGLGDLTGPGANITPTYTARYNLSGTDDNSGTTFDPTAGAQTVTIPGGGNIYVYVAGTVSAPNGQTNGAYSATVTLTVQYTGA